MENLDYTLRGILHSSPEHEFEGFALVLQMARCGEIEILPFCVCGTCVYIKYKIYIVYIYMYEKALERHGIRLLNNLSNICPLGWIKFNLFLQ